MLFPIFTIHNVLDFFLKSSQHTLWVRGRSACMIQQPVLFLFFLFSIAGSGCATKESPPVELVKPQSLPLQLDDRFQIRKIVQFFNEPNYFPITQSDAANFERSYTNFGAISQLQFDELRGNYFSCYWRTSQRTSVTARFEYRQIALGNATQAIERYYPSAHGSHKSTFNIIGSNYLEFGRVVSWRIVLIVDGKIVAFRQSLLWR